MFEPLGGLGSPMVLGTVQEFLRFMILRATEHPTPVDGLHSSFAPSLRLDFIWHCVLLETRTYSDLCAVLVDGGCVINHSVVVSNPIDRDTRLANTRAAYSARFGEPPHAWSWEDDNPVYKGAGDPKVQIFIKTLTGSTDTLVVQLNWTLGHLAYLYMMRGFVGWRAMRMVFSGALLCHGRTLEEHGIQSNRTLHMQMRLRGC